MYWVAMREEPALNPLSDFLKNCSVVVGRTDVVQRQGRVRRVTGLVMEVVGLSLPLGSVCWVQQAETQWLEAEVVGFREDTLFLMPFGSLSGLKPNALVKPKVLANNSWSLNSDFSEFVPPSDTRKLLPVGDALLGRVVDANGEPLDGRGPLAFSRKSLLLGEPINPLERMPVSRILDVGVRAINAMLTVGEGQRLGLFAGSGVGKSVLLGMMARYTQADRVVVGLIGERGREVKEFIEQILQAEGLARSVVVAAPADLSPLLRIQAAEYCSAIAETFRSEGHRVLLIMDSLTRFAMAQREIALAIGEPPATKGYPPSVFTRLPALVERAGCGAQGQGSITAFYTVLTEGDDQQDPIADAARAILDGHIVLSRELADAGHYPSIDIEKSISRVMHNLLNKDDLQAARQLKAAFSRVLRNRDLISVGAYVAGSDPMLDEALAHYSEIEAFLTQAMDEQCELEDSLNSLRKMFGLEKTTQQQVLA